MKPSISTQHPAWLDRQQYPFESRSIKLDAGTMHYIDQGEGEVLLFVHGTPVWSFVYRDLLKTFSNQYRVIAIDHIGFGLSEKPEGFKGSPQDHARNLEIFIERLDLRDINLVVHDFGGPIGLGAGIQTPDRIKQVILFNSWLWETSNNEEALKIDKVINSFIGRFLYLRLNFSPRVLLKKAFADRRYLSKDIHRQYIRPFPDKRSRMGLYRIAQSLVGSSDWYEEKWGQLSVLEDKPWLILWGMKDQFITLDYLQRWKERLPSAMVHTFQCGHFVQEEATEQAIRAIRDFIQDER